MKLHYIAENIHTSPELIRQTAEIMGDMIEYLYSNMKDQPEQQAMHQFLQQPSPRLWQNTKWIIDSLVKKSSSDRTLQTQAAKWNELLDLTSPVVTAALYDVDQLKARGTPIQQIAMGKQDRNKLKAAMGPLGYLTTFAGGNSIPKNKMRDLMNKTAYSSDGLLKAAKTDMKNIKPVSRF